MTADPALEVASVLACRACGQPARDPLAWRCACGDAFRLLDAARSETVSAALAPLLDLGQGGTPLIRAPFGDTPGLFLKLESTNPTGSFKDRGMAFLVSHARAARAQRVMIDSSGNAGASLAAFAGAAGIPATVFVAATTSLNKVLQIEAYGAAVARIDGSRSDVERAARSHLHGAYFASHAWSPLFIAGVRSLAIETIEQLQGCVPHHVIVPVGHGTLYLGIAAAFRDEAARLGCAVPRCHAVQSSSCAPLASTSDDGDRAGGDTIAEGIRVARPLRAREIHELLAKTRGRVVTVEDAPVRQWWLDSALRGVLMEPTSAAALAGYGALRADATISDEETVVVPVTGHGLKTLVGAGAP